MLAGQIGNQKEKEKEKEKAYLNTVIIAPTIKFPLYKSQRPHILIRAKNL